VSNSKSDLQGH